MMYDINLIPKAKKTSGEFVLVTTVLILSVLLVSGYYGVFVPLQYKYRLKQQIRMQEIELESYSKTLTAYGTLTTQINRLRETNTSLDTIKGQHLIMTELLDDIEKNIPDEVTIDKLSLNNNLISIEAKAPTYREIAQFIVRLRKVDKVESITFMSANKSDAIQEIDVAIDSELLENDNPIKVSDLVRPLHNFTIHIALNSIDTIENLQLDSASTDIE